MEEAEKIEKPAYNPALMTELHKDGDEEELEIVDDDNIEELDPEEMEPENAAE